MKLTILIVLAVPLVMVGAICIVLHQWSKMLKDWEDNLKEEETKDLEL